MKAAISVSLCAAALALTVVTASTPAAKPEDVGLSSERLQRISQMVQRRIDAGQLAGAVTAVARRGKVAHISAQGVMDLESKQPMTPATMFRIASMTKPVIGVAIMMMVEEGKLRLNDPVSRYIPEFRRMKVGVRSRAVDGRGAQHAAAVLHRAGAAGDHGQGSVDARLGPRQRARGNSDIAKVARKEGEKLADYIPRLGTRARIPARVALDVQPRRRLRDAGPHRRDRLGDAARPVLPQRASSIRWA